MTPEEESDALLDALARGELPDSGDPAARLLAALLDDTLGATGDDGLDDGLGDVGQWRSSVSMTPST
uniref:hypothetical protein n=1 Tax=Nonomuraea pusilla TaxID=46177 RepID=UPI0006E33662|nr:hypothetical protein [Nonomuraea pusilla]